MVRPGGHLSRFISASALALVLLVVPSSAALANPGELDASFNGTGKLLVDFGGNDRATQAAITPDGRIVVVGSTDASGGGDYALARVNANGALDNTFSEDGLQRVGSQSGVNDIGGSVVVLPDESIVVTGQGNSTKDFFTEQLTPTAARTKRSPKPPAGRRPWTSAAKRRPTTWSASPTASS